MCWADFHVHIGYLYISFEKCVSRYFGHFQTEFLVCFETVTCIPGWPQTQLCSKKDLEILPDLFLVLIIGFPLFHGTRFHPSPGVVGNTSKMHPYLLILKETWAGSVVRWDSTCLACTRPWSQFSGVQK